MHAILLSRPGVEAPGKRENLTPLFQIFAKRLAGYRITWIIFRMQDLLQVRPFFAHIFTYITFPSFSMDKPGEPEL